MAIRLEEYNKNQRVYNRSQNENKYSENDKDEENDVVRADANLVHPNERSDQHHRCAGGADEVREQTTDQEENYILQRCGLARGLDVDAASHNEERADERDE